MAVGGLVGYVSYSSPARKSCKKKLLCSFIFCLFIENSSLHRNEEGRCKGGGGGRGQWVDRNYEAYV